jgi:hypothetical protein
VAHATGTADRDQPSRCNRLNRTLTARPERATPPTSSLPARGSDNADYGVEVDVRAMKGEYVDESGKARFGTFGFF